MSVIIRLQNLPWSANASHIRRFFSGLSIPEGGVHIVGGENGDAFIGFSTDDDARRAMYLDEHALNGASVKLRLSSVSEMQTVIAKARGHFAAANPPPPNNNEPIVQRIDENKEGGRFGNHGVLTKPKGYSFFEPGSHAPSDTRGYKGGFVDPRKEMAQPPRPPEIFKKSDTESFPWKKKDEAKDNFNGGYPSRSNILQSEKPLLNDYRYSHQESRDSVLHSSDRVPPGRFPVPESRFSGNRDDQYNKSRYPLFPERDRSSNNRLEDQNATHFKNRAHQDPYFSRDDREGRFLHMERKQLDPSDYRNPQNLAKPQVFDYGHSADKAKEDLYFKSEETRNRSYDTNYRNRNPNKPGRDFPESRDHRGTDRYDSDDRAVRRPNKPFERPRPGNSGHPADYRGDRREFNEEYPMMRNPGQAMPSSVRPFFEENEHVDFKMKEYSGPPQHSRMEGGFVEMQFDRQSNFKKEVSEGRDFSVRPPWLTQERENPINVNQSFPSMEPNGFRKSENAMRNKPSNALMPTPISSYDDKTGHKRPSNDRNTGYQPPAKQSKSYAESDPNNFHSSKDSNTVVRVSTIPEKTNINALFQFLKGVKVVLKWGVRAENDKMNRPTGYIFIKCQTPNDADSAISFSNQIYNGAPALISRSTDDEFYSSGDSHAFRNIPIPPHVTKSVSYYFGDNCIEITGLKKFVDKDELKEFLELENVSNEDIFIGDYSSQMTVIRVFLKLPDKIEADKVLKKSGLVFKDYGTIKTWPISVLQLDKFKKEAKVKITSEEPDLKPIKKPESNSEEKSPKLKPLIGNAVVKTSDKKAANLGKGTEEELNCLEITNLPKLVTKSEITRLFPFINLEVNTFHFVQNNTKAIIEFKSSSESRKALFTTRRAIRGVSVIMKQISEAQKNELIDNKPNKSIQANDQTTCSEQKSQSSVESIEPKHESSSSQDDPESPSKKSALRFEVSVTNLPMGYTADRVKDFFKGFALYTDDPVVLKLSAQGKPLGEATIAFRNAVEADRAIRDLNGRRLAGRSISMKSLF